MADSSVHSTCPNCGGTLIFDKNKGVIQCENCGYLEIIPKDTEVEKVKIKADLEREKIQSQERQADKDRISRDQQKERHRQHEENMMRMKHENDPKEREFKRNIKGAIVAFGFVLAMFGIMGLMALIEDGFFDRLGGQVKIKFSSKTVLNESYQVAYNSLNDAGFKNIELVPVYDLTEKDGKGSKKEYIVTKVTVGGKDSFKEKDSLNVNDNVKIYYHDYKVEESYQTGTASLQSKDWDEAIRIFSEIKEYKDSSDRLREAYYGKAKELLSGGKKQEVYSLYLQLNGDSKVREQWLKDKDLSEAIFGEMFTAGNTVTLGHIEQDKKTDNGEESIEWTVLAVEDERALLVSKKILRPSVFSNSDQDANWQNSEINVYLNGWFLDNAFNENEKAALQTQRLNDNYEACRIFLLSEEEIQKYMPDADGRKAGPTKYAQSQGADKELIGSNGWWWLRNIKENGEVAIVKANGDFSSKKSTDKKGGIRPAVWITLDSETLFKIYN